MLVINDTFGCYLSTIGTFVIYSIYAIIKKKDRIATVIVIAIFIILSIFTVKDGRNIAATNLGKLITDFDTVLAKFGIETKASEGKDDKQIMEEFKEVGTRRGVLWENTPKIIMKKPIIGYGAENLVPEYNKYWMDGSDRPHNLILYLACVSGIPGMLIFVIFWY